MAPMTTGVCTVFVVGSNGQVPRLARVEWVMGNDPKPNASSSVWSSERTDRKDEVADAESLGLELGLGMRSGVGRVSQIESSGWVVL
ncbi:uncharacterized protein ColSpa_02065 [Colletotrichum spaethianum]|uniref:Uncharacterized protein n=1 Tax=Colletotrichum spaethianum TaxID=700344 RepID=A0AA37P738_9PEZI|nr:uncharacterized protein ColSpa_02065 [Colletotrichum spaethianum]GKT41884.1 hypothetical protein ColSpa_02065 [Colletotrichum spaethianum]